MNNVNWKQELDVKWFVSFLNSEALKITFHELQPAPKFLH